MGLMASLTYAFSQTLHSSNKSCSSISCRWHFPGCQIHFLCCVELGEKGPFLISKVHQCLQLKHKFKVTTPVSSGFQWFLDVKLRCLKEIPSFLFQDLVQHSLRIMVYCRKDTRPTIMQWKSINCRRQTALWTVTERAERKGGLQTDMRTEGGRKRAFISVFFESFLAILSGFLWRPGVACWVHTGRIKRSAWQEWKKYSKPSPTKATALAEIQLCFYSKREIRNWNKQKEIYW